MAPDPLRSAVSSQLGVLLHQLILAAIAKGYQQDRPEISAEDRISDYDIDKIEHQILALASASASPHAKGEDWNAFDGSLTIRFLQYINAKRAVRWHQNGGIKSWSALEWAGAMAGEAGEACNAAKKLKRIEDQIANINLKEGRSLTDEQNASSQVVDEIADTVIYGVLLAERVGLDLEEAIRMKFNRKSEEYGFPERIPPNQPPSALPASLEPLKDRK